MNKRSLLTFLVVTIALCAVIPPFTVSTAPAGAATRSCSGPGYRLLAKKSEERSTIQNPAASSESSMTLQATIDYIREKLERYAVWDFDFYRVQRNFGTITYKVEKVSGCKITLSSHMKHTGVYNETTVVQFDDDVAVIPLWALGRTIAYADDKYPRTAFVALSTRDYAKLIDLKSMIHYVTYREFNKDSQEEKAVDSFSIRFGRSDADNLDIAERVAKAFSHATDLCCASQPSDSDPFAPTARTPCGSKR